MAKKVLSIVIGPESTKVCEVSYKKNYKNKGIRVYRSITFPTPQNAIEDGYIKNVTLFGNELRLRLKTSGFKADRVIFTISSSKIANREILIPPAKDKRIMDIIKTGASDYFPIDIRDYIISYQILEKDTTKQGNHDRKKRPEQVSKDASGAVQKESGNEAAAAKRQMRLSVYAVPSTLVSSYYSFAKTMHFNIISLDYSGNSSYQLLKRQANRGTNVFVQMNEKDTLISILRDDTLILQRTVGYGISMLADSVMEQDYFQIKDKTKALELLGNSNLLIQKPDLKALSQSALPAYQNIAESLQFLTNSIARMLDYYRNSHKHNKMNEIYLTGAGALVQGIDQFFASEIGIAGKKLNKLWNVSASRKAVDYRRNPGEYIASIGAVINPVGFEPKELAEKKQRRVAILTTALFAAICLAGSAVVIYLSYSDYLAATKKLVVAKEQLTAIPQDNTVREEYDNAAKEIDSLKQLEDETVSANDNISLVIKELEDKLPQGVRINSLQITENGIAMEVTAQGSDLNALAAKLYLQLETIEYFSKVDISDITIDSSEAASRVNLSLTCLYAK